MVNSTRHSNLRSETAEEYLEAIYKLSRGTRPVTVTALAETLDVSAASASEMVRRLRDAALVAPARTRAVELSKQGEYEALRLIRRHRLSERFLVDFLGMSWDSVHDEACRLEHVLTPEVEERLARQLGHPRTCPHGYVIPGADGSIVEDAVKRLDLLGAGEAGIIARIAEEDGELLRYLGSLGLTPDTPVAVESVAPFGGPILVRVAGSQYAIGREVAGKILVRD